jgi:hypothetical protein
MTIFLHVSKEAKRAKNMIIYISNAYHVMNSFNFVSFMVVPVFATRDKCAVPEEVVFKDMTIESEDYIILWHDAFSFVNGFKIKKGKSLTVTGL